MRRVAGRDASGRIVVGVDGSAGSRRALVWAVQEGRLRGAAVVALYACPYPVLAPSMEGIATHLPGADFEREARSVLEREVAAIEPSEVTLELAVSELSPAPALVRASEGADLVVVGSRGHGGFAGLLLGSVGQHCANHAKCPVVIVH